MKYEILSHSQEKGKLRNLECTDPVLPLIQRQYSFSLAIKVLDEHHYNMMIHLDLDCSKQLLGAGSNIARSRIEMRGRGGSRSGLATG